MKQMVYQSNRKIELLHKDTYKGYNFYILNLGTHPTAYVEIPKESELFGKGYDDIDLYVHGGLTYAEDFLYTSEDTKLDDSWFIGWDYAHAGDYFGYYEKYDYLETFRESKKWTTEEIIKECKSAIDQIVVVYDDSKAR